MFEYLFLGILVRTGQILIEASTTLLCGLLVAGVMRRMMGQEGTRRLFGGKGWRGLLRAWAIGTLLPVCSLGVIPIARELRRSGVPSGTILAFVLAAPHINPISLLYGLTLSEPLVIICFAFGSLVIAFTAGAMWERLFARSVDELPQERGAGDREETSVAPHAPRPSPLGAEPMPAPGIKRLAAVAVTAARESVSSTMGYVVIALAFTGIFAGLLPQGILSMTMKHDDPTATALMTGIALPLYVGPLQGMMRLGLMFEHGNSVGAAFTLFELGIGVNLGLIIWLGVLFGPKRALLWLVLVAALAMGLGYAVDRPLYFASEEVSHTHAFDDWTSPFAGPANATWEDAEDKLLQKVQVLEPIGLGGLGLLILLGLALASCDRAGRIEAWLTRPSPERAPAAWDVNVPGPVLGLAALAGLAAFSVAALYIYYPAPREAFVMIFHAHNETSFAVRKARKEEAIRHIEEWDLLTRKLQVGAFIRTGHLDPEATQATEDLRERLEELRDALLADDVGAAKNMLPAVEKAYSRCRSAHAAALD